MKLIAPIILLLHWIGIFVYYCMVMYFPEQYNYYGWSVYYFSVNNFTIINYAIMFCFFKKKQLGEWCNRFVFIDIMLTVMLSFTIILECKGIIKSTYGLFISILGMIITVVMILISGIKHGIFKNNSHKNA